jgi:hypothetical protein
MIAKSFSKKLKGTLAEANVHGVSDGSFPLTPAETRNQSPTKTTRYSFTDANEGKGDPQTSNRATDTKNFKKSGKSPADNTGN